MNIYRILSRIWHISIGLLFFWDTEAMFRSLAGMDPIREEELHYLATRIVHYTAIIAIPVLILIFQLIPSVEENSDNTATDSVGIFILYLVSFLLVVSGFLFPKIITWRYISQISKVGIFQGHVFQMLIFFIPVVLSLLISRGKTSFLVVLPAICLCFIAMIVTFPTKNRWEKWTGYTSLLD